MQTEGTWRPHKAQRHAVAARRSVAVDTEVKRTNLLAEALRPGKLEEELNSGADRVQEELAAMDAQAKPKRAALAAQAQLQESGKARAARYFANHGMKAAGQKLGLDMS